VKKIKKYTLPIVIEKDEEGYFEYCPALQGCYTQGETYEEVIENIKDGIRLHFEDMVEKGEKIPESYYISLSTLER